MASSNPSDIPLDEQARAILEASLDEIAVAAAAIELAEPERPSEPPVVMGSALLTHARSKFGIEVDLLPALMSLCTKEILFEQSNEDAAVVIPRLSELALYLTAGRAGRDLGQLPIPRLATNVFEAAIRRRLEPFEYCVYGVGVHKTADLYGALLAEERRRKPGELVFTRDRDRPMLMLQLYVGSEPVYCGARFEDEQHRNQAMAMIASIEQKLFGLDVELAQSYSQPQVAVAARRFLVAVERATGQQLGTPHSVPRTLDASRHIGPTEHNSSAKLAELFRLARSVCSDEERRAFELVDRRRIAYNSDGDGLLTVEIFGKRDGIFDMRSLLGSTEVTRRPFARGPYRDFELQRALHIEPGERIGTLRYRSRGASGYDVYDGLIDLSQSAIRYNSFQDKLAISLDRDHLTDALNAAATRTYQDAQLLAPVLTEPGTLVHAHHTYLSISPSPTTTGKNRRAGDFTVKYARMELPYAEPEKVTVHFDGDAEQSKPAWVRAAEVAMADFEVDLPHGLLSHGVGVGSSVLANFLGYMAADVVFLVS